MSHFEAFDHHQSKSAWCFAVLFTFFLFSTFFTSCLCACPEIGHIPKMAILYRHISSKPADKFCDAVSETGGIQHHPKSKIIPCFHFSSENPQALRKRHVETNSAASEAARRKRQGWTQCFERPWGRQAIWKKIWYNPVRISPIQLVMYHY